MAFAFLMVIKMESIDPVFLIKVDQSEIGFQHRVLFMIVAGADYTELELDHRKGGIDVKHVL